MPLGLHLRLHLRLKRVQGRGSSSTSFPSTTGWSFWCARDLTIFEPNEKVTILRRGGGEKTSETRIGWKIRISFGESLSTRVVPSRGRVRGNPIRQADVN